MITTPEEAGRLRHETPQRLRKRLKGDLDAIVMAALQKDPLQRYASVEGLARDVRRYLDGQPVTARKASTAYRLRKLAARHKLGVAAGATILGLLVALAVTSTLQASRIRKERDRATDEAAKVTAMNVFLQDALGAADPWEKGSRNISLLDALRQAQAKAESAFHGQPLIRAAILQTIGSTFANLAEFQEGEKALRTALVLRTAAAGPRSPEVADSQASLSNLYGLWHRFDEAVKSGRESLEITRELHGPRSLEAAAAMDPLGQAYQRKGDLQALKPLAEEMLAIVRDPRTRSGGASHRPGGPGQGGGPGPQPPGRGGALRGELPRMEALDRERLDKIRARLPELRSLLSMAVNDLATAQARNGDLAAAEANYKEALAINTADVGEEHPETLSVRENLGDVYFRRSATTRHSAARRGARAAQEGARGGCRAGGPNAGQHRDGVQGGGASSTRPSSRTATRWQCSFPSSGSRTWTSPAVRFNLGDVLRRRGDLDERRATDAERARGPRQGPRRDPRGHPAGAEGAGRSRHRPGQAGGGSGLHRPAPPAK